MLSLVCLTAAAAPLLAPPAQVPQDGAPAPRVESAAREVEGPVDFGRLEGILQDGAVAVADEEVITLLELEQTYAILRQRNPVNSVEDEQALRSEAIRAMVVRSLAAQAGAELGIPAEAVRGQAEVIESDRANAAGVLEYGESLRRQGVDPLTAKRRTRGDIYRRQWQAFVTGSTNYGGGRPAVDTFVRPGELRAYYLVRLDELGTPAEVTLQVITLDAAASGNQELAVENGQFVLDELGRGESWNELASLYSSTFRESSGVRPRQSLSKIEDRDLRRFASEAEAGDVSTVLERRGPTGELIGVQVARIIERTEGEPPPAFDDPELQGQIRSVLKRSREGLLLRMAEDRLLIDSYAWTAMTGILEAGPQGTK